MAKVNFFSDYNGDLKVILFMLKVFFFFLERLIRRKFPVDERNEIIDATIARIIDSNAFVRGRSRFSLNERHCHAGSRLT